MDTYTHSIVRPSRNAVSVRLLVLISILAIGLFTLLGPVAPAGAVPALTNPSHNIGPNPNFLVSGSCVPGDQSTTCANPCVTTSYTWPVFSNSPRCAAYVVLAINNAKAKLGESPISLPTNWYRLTPQQQTFVIVNLERISLGYPAYLGMNSALDVAAQTGANNYSDPLTAPGFRIGYDAQGYPEQGGAWSEGFSVLAADYYWMYSDGWGGSANTTSNIACTSATAAGCWGHRDEILGSGERLIGGAGIGCTTCEVGTGWTDTRGVGSWDVLIERPAASPPVMVFSWASEVPYLTTYTAPTTSTLPVTTTTLVPTTGPTTGPTTQLAALGPISVRVVGLNYSDAQVRWSSNTTMGLATAQLSTYKGTGCVSSNHWVRETYNTRSNVQSGYLSSSGPRYYSPAGVFSGRVTITNAAGSRSSACFSLGRS